MRRCAEEAGRRGRAAFVFLATCLLPLAACQPLPTLAPTYTSAPTITPTLVVVVPSDTPGVTPSPVPSPTPAPTLNAADVGAVVSRGRARLEAMGVEPLCLRWEDTDADGEAEWLGLHWQAGEPARLAAFVLDGDAWHELRALEGGRYGLGEHPTCELEVRDINVDGRDEILIWGHAEASVELLHVFVWDGAAYVLLASFEGRAGVRLENVDGDLADEIFEGYVDAEAGDDFVWEAVYTWDGASYGWTWERYRWFYLDRPHAYRSDTPKRAVISFYLAIDDRDLSGAYGLLSPAAQAAQGEEAWTVGFVTTIAVEVGSVHEISRSGETAVVVAQMRAYDNVGGRVMAALWDLEWLVVQTADGWRLESASAEQLERWEAVYYP